MNMLTFELPEVLYKVRKTYDISYVPRDLISDVEEMVEDYHFKDVNLAQELYSRFTNRIEIVKFFSKNGEYFELELKIIPIFDVINTLDLIPEIIDLYY